MKFAKLVKEAAPKKMGGRFGISATPSTSTTEPQPTEDSDKIAKQAQPLVTALNKISDEEDFDISNIGQGEEITRIKKPEGAGDKPTINYKIVNALLHLAWNTKKPFLIYGDSGIGKSGIIDTFAERVAQSRGKQFIKWKELSQSQKIELVKNPSGKFVLIDQRTNGLTPEDFMGVPVDFSSEEFLKTKVALWIYLLSQPETEAILFLDEMNQAPRQTLQKLYQLTDETSPGAGDLTFSKNVLVVGAGNLGSRFEEPIPEALSRRFDAGILIADPESWLDWAEAGKLDKYIISFVKANPKDNFYVVPKESDDPFPNPAGMKKLSDKLKGPGGVYSMYKQAAKEGTDLGINLYDMIHKAAAMSCGEHWADKFIIFLKHIRTFDFKKVVQGIPKSLSKDSIDKLHALVVFVVGRLRLATSSMLNSGDQKNPNDVEILEGIAKITNSLDKEWQLILWNTIKRDLPRPNLEQAVKFLSTGNYDPATKDQFRNKSLPGFKTILAS